ncbi:MAG TPA: response regulator [Gemmatimonadales bacterium]|nr:response regulator [Gemmatimonadales bacterium]
MAEAAAPRILLVDDDPDITRLVQHVLAAGGYGTAMQVGTGREALNSLDGIDIVLLDHQLPDTSGLEVLTAIRAQPQPPGIILVTAHGNESLAAAALRLGADDYLAKDAALAELLPQIIERVRRSRELRKALAAAEQDLLRAERLAAIGEMTVTLHHEINNPLMAAFADIDLLLADTSAGSEQRRPGLESIRHALHRIRDIVQQIGRLREARSKDYLRGVRMLDLNREEADSRSPNRGIALVHLPDEDLVRVVSLLLRDAGFAVRRVDSVAQLEAGASSIGVSLVVIAGGATTPGAHALGGFVPASSRDYLVVALVTGGEAAVLAAGADQVVQLPFDPRTFTADILRGQAPTAQRR